MSNLTEIIKKALSEKKEQVPNFYKIYNDVNNYKAIPSAKKNDNILLFVQNKTYGVSILVNKKYLPVSFVTKVSDYPSEIQYVLFPKSFEKIKEEIKAIKIVKDKEYIIKLVDNFIDFPKELNIEITIDKDFDVNVSGLFDINKGFVGGIDNFLNNFTPEIYIKMINKINKRLLEDKQKNFILYK